MLGRIWKWLVDDLTWGGVFFACGLFAATFVVSLLVAGFLLVRLPATYFLDSHNRDFWVNGHPVLRMLGRIGKNLLGVVLIIMGAARLFGPGQGILTVLIGVMLMDFPGKRALERKLVSRPTVLRAINRLRARYGRPPLILGETDLKEPALSVADSDPTASEESVTR
jgi:hypothetical protein